MNTAHNIHATLTCAGFGIVANDAPVAMLDKLLSLRGQFVSMTTSRPAKVLKGREPITKVSTFVCRVGCDYDNLRSVQDKREAGELPAVNAGLPWGEWLAFPYIIRHKGQHYFRCTSVTGNANCVPKVVWMRDGKVVAKDDILNDLAASEKGAHDERDVFNVKVESILTITVAGEVLTA